MKEREGRDGVWDSEGERGRAKEGKQVMELVQERGWEKRERETFGIPLTGETDGSVKIRNLRT